MKYLLIIASYFYSSAAFAQDAGGSAPSSPIAPNFIESMLPFGLMFVVFYFLLIRPQQKKYKLHAVMVGGLKKGDKVITGAGFVGTVVKAAENEKFITVKIADNVEVEVLRSSITELAGDKEKK